MTTFQTTAQMWRLRWARRPRWLLGPEAYVTRSFESTLEEMRWETVRKASRRSAWIGAVIGGVIGVVAFAPASWLANGVSRMTGHRLLLADAQGTIWQGQAVAVLTGGPGSRDARALPGRLNWTLRWQDRGVRVVLQHDCCLPQPVAVQVRPGWRRARVDVGLVPAGQAGGWQSAGTLGHWPAAWLSGLGTPWNTLQLGGVMRVSANTLAIEWVSGRVRVSGQADVWLDNVSSSLTTLDRLGSYHLGLQADEQGLVQMSLRTVDGALQLSGQGTISAGGTSFQGEAQAAEAERGALDNLLNIIGRRSGDRSVISIG
ncbi:type II secretion system protein N [Aquabacterium sp.]|uniref:type II secretion system protein N n=1 Tax=Aquabacterium sp. TaxID=1872578 RepID=UPI0025B98156|nr:type II secretion system protein N [Aquabacterium sp.]MDQ5926312.1 Type secretion system protein [Pseudomonadota bacterium]